MAKKKHNLYIAKINLVHRTTKMFVPAGEQIDLSHCTPEAIAWAVEVGQIYDPEDSLPGDLIPEDEVAEANEAAEANKVAEANEAGS